MSPNPPLPPPDDPIARATGALRRTPVPDGPPPETIARTLAALRAAAEEPDTIPGPRRRILFAMWKMAATILAAAAGVWYFAGFPPRSATAEFVEAARKLQEARTLSLLHTQTIASQPETMNSHKILLLNPADQSAMLLEEQGAGPAPKRDGAAMMIEEMRRLAGEDNEPVGEKVIGGVRARGFRVKEQGQDMTIWVDPRMKLPVLIEFSGRAGHLDYRGTFSEIRLDVELDDALFRLEPPAGYTLRKADARMNLTFEEAVARWLRNDTRASGGRFPARLDDLDGRSPSPDAPGAPRDGRIGASRRLSAPLGRFSAPSGRHYRANPDNPPSPADRGGCPRRRVAPGAASPRPADGSAGWPAGRRRRCPARAVGADRGSLGASSPL